MNRKARPHVGPSFKPPRAITPHRHFERSRPTFSSRFAPAKRSACAERNLSSSFLGLRTEDLCTIAANSAVMNPSSLSTPARYRPAHHLLDVSLESPRKTEEKNPSPRKPAKAHSNRPRSTRA